MMKFLKIIIRLFLLFLFISAFVPPLFHKKADVDMEQSKATGSSAQERVLILDDNTEALLWRLRLIESAEQRIVLVTFDFWDDNSGTDIMAALFHAADRNVQVQVLVDGLGGVLHLGDSGHFRELAEHPNVEIRFYNSINLLLPWKGNYRMHDKYLIADDFAYILGGRNTGDLFLGNYISSYNEDRDVLVYETVADQGESYCELTSYFEKIWNLPCCKVYKGYGKATEELEKRYAELSDTYPEVFQETDWMASTKEVKHIALLSGEMGTHNKEPIVWSKMLAEIQDASEVTIITPYVICSWDMYADMERLCENGMQLEIIINAVESGANPFGCTDYLSQKRQILKTGATVCEYWGEQSLHTKTILAGDDISIIGSCNIDMRSVYLDTELMLVIESEEINEELRRYAEGMETYGKLVSSDGILAVGCNYGRESLSIRKKMRYEIVRFLILPFRHLL